MTRRWKSWRGALLAALLSLLAAGAWGLVRESLTAADWAVVERRDLVIGIDLEGDLVSLESAEIGPPQVPRIWDFKISMMAPEGSEVEEGQPVLAFDTTRLDQELLQKVAERDGAQKRLEKTRTDFEIRRRDLELRRAEAEAAKRRADLKLAVPAEIARRKELEQARIDLRLAAEQIDFLERKLEHLAAERGAELEILHRQRDRAAARVAETERHVEQMTVPAPRAGTVIYKTDWRGDKKKIGDSAWRGQKVLEIPDLGRMRATGQVAEADAGRLALGQPVSFRLDAYPDAEYRGTVARIRRTVRRKSPSNPEKVVRLDVELAATDTARMRPGMRLRGTVEVERLADVLVVPGAALFPGPEGSAVYRRTLLGGRQRLYPTFGKRSREYFAVEAGLEAGDRILRRGAGEDAP